MISVSEIALYPLDLQPRMVEIPQEIRQCESTIKNLNIIESHYLKNQVSTLKRIYQLAYYSELFSLGEKLHTMTLAQTWHAFYNTKVVVIHSKNQLKSMDYFYERNSRPSYQKIKYNIFHKQERILFIFRENQVFHSMKLVDFFGNRFAIHYKMSTHQQNVCHAFCKKYLEIEDRQHANKYGIILLDYRYEDENKEHKYPIDTQKPFNFIFKYQCYNSNKGEWRWHITYDTIAEDPVLADIEVSSNIITHSALNQFLTQCFSDKHLAKTFENNIDFILKSCYEALLQYYSFRIMKHMAYEPDYKSPKCVQDIIKKRNQIKRLKYDELIGLNVHNDMKMIRNNYCALLRYFNDLKSSEQAAIPTQNLTNDIKFASKTSPNAISSKEELEPAVDAPTLSTENQIISNNNDYKILLDLLSTFEMILQCQTVSGEWIRECSINLIILKFYGLLWNNQVLLNYLQSITSNEEEKKSYESSSITFFYRNFRHHREIAQKGHGENLMKQLSFTLQKNNPEHSGKSEAVEENDTNEWE